MIVSCAFATSLQTPEHIALAERLGYLRAWCYDSPALYPDVWMTLALAASRTATIGLGPAVLVPHLRHVMTNAAAIATLEAQAPGRVAYAVGSGFTGRLAMGQRPLPWKDVRAYVLALKALLQGETVEWEGAAMRLLHLDGFAPPRPINVPVLIGAAGPRGLAVGRELGDGIFLTSAFSAGGDARFSWLAQTANGTVLDEDELASSPRAYEAGGYAAALIYHAAYVRGTIQSLPSGPEYAAYLDAKPELTRHLALHEGHLITLNEADRRFITPAIVARLGKAMDPAGWRTRLAQMESQGVTEVAYQPAGPDIPRELTAFAAMAGLVPRTP